MLYTISKRQNPLDRTAEPKFYATPKWSEEITTQKLAEEISKACTLHPIDVEGVLNCLLQTLPLFLENGNTIRLGRFGLVKMTFRATGQEQADKVSTDDITDIRVHFRPSVDLLKELRANTTFRKQ